jgi:hypothetical protein
MPRLNAERRWSVNEKNAACFIVKDHEGKSLAYGLVSPT